MAGEVKKLQFSEGTDVGNPTDLSLATSTSHFKTFADDAAYLTDKGSAVAEGDVYINTTTGRIRFYEGGMWKNAVLGNDSSDGTKAWDVDLSGATTGTTTTLGFNQTANRDIDFPDAAGEVLLASNTKDVTNKTFIDNSTEIKSSTGTDRKAGWDASGATNSTKTTVRFNQTANRNIDMPDASDTLVGKATADVLTNKDIDGGTAANTRRITVPKDTLANLLLLTRKEGTILYATDTDTFYADDGTNLKPVGAGGAGEINLVQNPNDVNTGWAVTGSGPTAANTTTVGDLPLNSAVGITSAIKLTSAATAQAEASHYQAYSFTTPATMGRKLKVEIWMRPGSNFIANEWTVSIYQGATRQALSTDVSGVTYLPNITGKFVTTFDAVASTTYTLRFARPVNAGGNSAALNINGIIVGPGPMGSGAVVEDGVIDTTFTFGGFSPSSKSFLRRRVGTNMQVNGKMVSSGSSGATASVILPTGYSIDTSKYSNSANGTAVGFWFRQSSGASADINTSGAFYGAVFYDGSTTDRVFLTDQVGTSAFTKRNGSSFIGGTDDVSIIFDVHISQWAGTGVVNFIDNSFLQQNARVRYYVASTHSPSANTAVNLNTESPLVTKVGTWSNSSGEITVPAPGVYRISYVLDMASAAAGFTPYVALGGVQKIKGAFKGTGETPEGSCIISITNPSTETISIRATANINNVQGADASSYVSIERVADYTGQAVGFGEVNPGVSSGLVGANGVKGRKSSTAVASGYVGESGIGVGATTSFVTNTTTTCSTQVLDPGTWLVSGSYARASVSAIAGTQRVWVSLCSDADSYVTYEELELTSAAGVAFTGESGLLQGVFHFSDTQSANDRTVAVRTQVLNAGTITGSLNTFLKWVRIA